MNTKKIITDAAFRLFEEIPFEDITVQKILDSAQVSRRTFYKYFEDKYDLMHMYYYDIVDKYIDENFDGHNWASITEKILLFISSHKEYFNNVKNVQGQNSFWDYLSQYGFSFYEKVKLTNEHRSELTEWERLTIIAGCEGSIAILKRYIEGNISMDYREIAKLICSLLPESYHNYL